MELKVLLTGHNRRIAADISDHLKNERGCFAVSCSPTKSALFATVLSELPNVIIICLGDETKETVKTFDVLSECNRLGAATIIVVANDPDRATFINHTVLERVFFLARPVSLFALYDKLNEIEEKLEYEKECGRNLLTEWTNPVSKEACTRKHILVVDDDPEQLSQIKEHLKEFYEVTLVTSGKNIEKFLQRYYVDLILLDYLMPDMDGPQALALLRANPDYKNIPVIFLTGVSEKETVIKTLVELKPEGYVLKPTKKSDLVAKIIDVLDTAQSIHVLGRGDNRTDLTVRLQTPQDPARQTIFENCVADVNIPVG